MVNKLYVIEVALGPVTGTDTLHLAIDAAKAFDFPLDDGLISSFRKVRDEARKITDRRKRLQRLGKKYGGLPVVFSRMVVRMENALHREYGFTELDQNDTERIS